MKTITVVANDRIGLLADISYILSKSKINIEGVSVDVCSGLAIIAITVKNHEKAEKVLAESGYSVNKSDTLVVKHPKCDTAKTEIVDILARQKILVENFDLISNDPSNCFFAMHVNRPRKAVKVLGGMLINRPA